MDFRTYQDRAFETDQSPERGGAETFLIPLLGLAGEMGGVLTEFKKVARDTGYTLYKDKLEEELGDILWYVANIATRLGLSLDTIAKKNLYKTNERWPIGAGGAATFLDEEFPTTERFPRRFEVRFHERVDGMRRQVSLAIGDETFGDRLTDNAYFDDGYRFHDALHLANVAVLGWSPVMRALLKRKRKSDPRTDEVEDGARAILLEEMLVAYVYNDASSRSLYESTRELDGDLLALIRQLVASLEVNRRTAADWERAIFQGYAAFRFLLKHGGGTVTVDLDARTLDARLSAPSSVREDVSTGKPTAPPKPTRRARHSNRDSHSGRRR